jgi:hypothetical protein
MKFFHILRQRFLKDNKFSKYLLYAVGEIMLVVIGILIALQVDTWNEERKIAAQEQQVLRSLHAEIEFNKTVLRECMNHIEQSIDTTHTLQAYLGPNHAGLSNKRVLGLLSASSYVPSCNVVTDVLEELRSSGNLQFIQNREMRQAISRWSRAYQTLRSEEAAWSRDFANQYTPYTNKWISWDDFEYFRNPKDPMNIPSPFTYDANKMLQQFEFANVLNTMYWRMARERYFIQQLDNHTHALDSLITKALD